MSDHRLSGAQAEGFAWAITGVTVTLLAWLWHRTGLTPSAPSAPPARVVYRYHQADKGELGPEETQ